MKRWTIKVDDDTRVRLLAIQRVREDMDDVIVRLLNLWDDTERMVSRLRETNEYPPKVREVVSASEKTD